MQTDQTTGSTQDCQPRRGVAARNITRLPHGQMWNHVTSANCTSQNSSANSVGCVAYHITLSLKKKLSSFLSNVPRFRERALLFGWFPGFASLSLWQEKRADEYKYGELDA